MKYRSIAADYILRNFEPSDRLAVVVLNKRTGPVMQRISTAERIASLEFQAWLGHQNAKGWDIYLSMNALNPEADRRTKNDIGNIRHIYLDFDQDGEDAATRIIENSDLPMPNYVVETSPDKRHVIWRVDGFSQKKRPSTSSRIWLASGARTPPPRIAPAYSGCRASTITNTVFRNACALSYPPAIQKAAALKIFPTTRLIGCRPRDSVATRIVQRSPVRPPNRNTTGRLPSALLLAENRWSPSLPPLPSTAGTKSRTPATMPLTRSGRRLPRSPTNYNTPCMRLSTVPNADPANHPGKFAYTGMRRISFFLFLISTLKTASASTITSTFGPDDSFFTFAGYQVGANIPGSVGVEMAVTFTPTMDYDLSQIRVAVFSTATTTGDRDLVLDFSQGALPGNPIETFSTTLAAGGIGRIYTFNSAVHSRLLAGQTYWVALSSNDLVDNSFGWDINNTGSHGLLADDSPGNSLWESFYDASPAFEVSGQPVETAATPEPGTMFFVSSALIFFGLLRRGTFRTKVSRSRPDIAPAKSKLVS